jgi:hypothetical protein
MLLLKLTTILVGLSYVLVLLNKGWFFTLFGFSIYGLMAINLINGLRVLKSQYLIKLINHANGADLLEHHIEASIIFLCYKTTAKLLQVPLIA